MSRYQPPHMRRAQSSSSNPKPSSPDNSASPRGSPAPNARPNNRQGQDRAWRPALSAPASDMKPMRVKAPLSAPSNDMEHMQSVSRSGGDGAEGDALKHWSTQERYRAYIDERIGKHHASYGGRGDASQDGAQGEELESLQSLVLLFRKLREGVVASHRIDAFAVEVFESSVRYSILARNTGQLLSSLSGLVPGLYEAYDKISADRDGPGISDRLAKLSLDDKRAEFASILMLYHLAQTASTSAYQSTLLDLTMPQCKRLRVPFAPVDANKTVSRREAGGFIQRPKLSFAIRAAACLSVEQFDPLRYYALLRDPTASTYERAVLSWTKDRVQQRAWDVLKKAYLEVRLEWASRWLDMPVDDVAKWTTQHGARVDGGKLKLR